MPHRLQSSGGRGPHAGGRAGERGGGRQERVWFIRPWLPGYLPLLPPLLLSVACLPPGLRNRVMNYDRISTVNQRRSDAVRGRREWVAVWLGKICPTTHKGGVGEVITLQSNDDIILTKKWISIRKTPPQPPPHGAAGDPRFAPDGDLHWRSAAGRLAPASDRWR